MTRARRGASDAGSRTLYVADWTIDTMASIGQGRDRALAELGRTSSAPGTLIGVAALFTPEHLVEIEAVAVVE